MSNPDSFGGNTPERIARLLSPRSIAIVGASSTPGALGASMLANLDRNGYTGEIHLINPKRDKIGDRPCLASVDQLPLGVDVAVLAIPKVAVLDTIRALAERKVNAAVIYSAGFAEEGGEGLRQQQEIARIAEESGMLIEGPNCLGCINFKQRVPLTFIEVDISKETAERNCQGDAIAILTQSGALMAVTNTTLSSRKLPLSYAISTGNEAVGKLEDFADFLIDDEGTRIIAMTAEHFRQPRKLLAIAEKAKAAGKHIVLLHPGRSAAARASAATHTGAMVGDYQVMRTKVERAGVILVDTLEELADVAEILQRCEQAPSKGTAIVGESGAFKALCLDLADQLGLDLPELTDEDSPALRKELPDFVGVGNPLDLTAQSLVDQTLTPRTLAALFNDDRFGTIMTGLIQTDPVTLSYKLPGIIRMLKELKPQKPLIIVGLDEGAVGPEKYIDELRALGVPYFPSHERALRAVKHLIARSERNFSTAQVNPALFELPAGDQVIPEYRVKQLLKNALPFGNGQLARSVEEAIDIAQTIHWPVVLKAQSSELSHKSDAGGVALNLKTPESLQDAWVLMHERIGQYDSAISLDGILVEAMGSAGLEMIVGARNDPEWGPVILAGFGGVTAEVIRDVVLLPPDLPREEVVQRINQLKGAPLLNGFRGSNALDVEALADVIVNLGAVMQAQPRVAEVDLNPVMLYPKGEGVMVLDALMRVES